MLGYHSAARSRPSGEYLLFMAPLSWFGVSGNPGAVHQSNMLQSCFVRAEGEKSVRRRSLVGPPQTTSPRKS